MIGRIVSAGQPSKKCQFDSMSDQVLPPDPRDVLSAGLPNLRHGRIHQHPVEHQLSKAMGERDDREFQEATLLFGAGFADYLRFERETIRRSQNMVAGLVDPSDLSMEISTGDIDEVDFCDMFAPSATRQAMIVDPHEWQERRVFEE
jgi:hypothetical protein